MTCTIWNTYQTQQCAAPYATGGPSLLLIQSACGVQAFFVITTWISGTRSMVKVHTSIELHHMDTVDGWASQGSDTVTMHTTSSSSGSSSDSTDTSNIDASSSSAASLSRILGALNWHSYHMDGAHSSSSSGLASGAAHKPRVTTLPDSERDIELHPERVDKIVKRAKAIEQMKMLSEGSTSDVDSSSAEALVVSHECSMQLSAG